MPRQPVIKIDGLWKSFVVRHNRTESLKQLVIGWLNWKRRERREVFWALEDVELQVHPGQMVGIIGTNGSGKSTLLRIISGIFPEDRGRVDVVGRVAPMIELGVGFHPELTGEENLYLNASLYGLSRQEIDMIAEDVIDFAELRDFIDVPTKNYSTGMYMRLGFAVAVHLNPDILLVDEVLAVGDESFQRKCLDKMQELKRKGVSILFVSHELDLVRRLCDRVHVLNRGRMVRAGSADETVDYYLAKLAHEKDARTLDP